MSIFDRWKKDTQVAKALVKAQQAQAAAAAQAQRAHQRMLQKLSKPSPPSVQRTAAQLAQHQQNSLQLLQQLMQAQASTSTPKPIRPSKELALRDPERMLKLLLSPEFKELIDSMEGLGEVSGFEGLRELLLALPRLLQEQYLRGRRDASPQRHEWPIAAGDLGGGNYTYTTTKIEMTDCDQAINGVQAIVDSFNGVLGALGSFDSLSAGLGKK